jgi:hypothetical protein
VTGEKEICLECDKKKDGITYRRGDGVLSVKGTVVMVTYE